MLSHDNPINFRALNEEDIPLIFRWFNAPHVQDFYSLRQWSEEEVFTKLKPILRKEKPILGFLIIYSQRPIGYIQYYRVADYPWPAQDIEEQMSNIAAGLDMFIGEASFIRKGIGPVAVSTFLEQIIWPKFSYCFVDPDARNAASIKMFQKCGFQFHKNIEAEDALKRPVTLVLMKIERP